MALTNQQLLDAYKAALMAVSANQSYTIDGKTLTRANLKDIRETIDWLEGKVYSDSNPGDLGIIQII